MKLYPPYIEGTIPAFYEYPEGTVILTVPFSMNRAVSVDDVVGFRAKVKTVQSNTYLFSLSTTSNIEFDIENEYEVRFQLGTNQIDNLQIGEYYKVQLAYIAKDGTVGYYSTVGVTKFTTRPLVKIESLVQHTMNVHTYTYTGLYRQYELNDMKTNIKDTTEKVHSYQFKITDKEGNIIEDSGILIHNNEKNTETYESIDEFNYRSEIPENIIYYIQYIVYTNNKMTVKSPKYKIVQKKSIPPEIDATIKATMNFDNGYVDVHLQGNLNEEGMEKAATGAFLITRACSDTHFTRWEEVFRFALHGQYPSFKLLRDFTVEQGKEYMYSLQQYNDYGLYSDRLLSNVIMADFEDMFLYDGERQLKIKYNPKVSSFKPNILENKTDTIGSKFPFIFRNGKVNYKSFPISGLISYLSDEENLFITDDELGLTEGYDNIKRPGTLKDNIKSTDDEFFWQFSDPDITSEQLRSMYKAKEKNEALMETAKPRTTSLVDYNMSAERTFKLAVLDWLTNGKIKLFRSPSEGNYLVVLVGASLTPEDKLSRMIHTFQADAYEMADFSYDDMLKENIIQLQKADMTQLRWEGLELVTDIDPNDERYQKIGDLWYLQGDILTTHSAANSVRFDGLVPGSKIFIRIKGQNLQTITIGVTGSYQVDLGLDMDIIRLPNDAQYQGTVTYSYYNDAQNVFNEVEKINIDNYLGQQFIGSQSNIIEQINNIKFNLLQFFYLHFDKRYIENYKDGVTDPYPLYLKEVDQLTAGGITVVGLEEVSNSIVERDLVGPSGHLTVSKRYYYINSSNLVISGEGKTYNPNLIYYIKKPLKTYIDLQNSNGKTIIDQDSYDRASMFLTRTGRDKNTFLSEVEILSYNLSIDGHILNLDEVEKFDIDENILFKSIEIDNGVTLECGYKAQEIIYNVEHAHKFMSRKTVKDGVEVNLQTTYQTYMDFLSIEHFQELLEGYSEELYIRQIEDARKYLPRLYKEYMIAVEEEKIAWEEDNRYE